MLGTASGEVEVKVPASEAWELYGTLRISKFVVEHLPHLFNKIEVLEGDGGLGTVLNVTFPPGTPGFTSYKEKYTKVDHENRVKEAEVVEGAYHDMGFTLFRIRIEVVEKSEESCITKATIEYEVKEEAASNASLTSIEPVVMVMEAVANYLFKNKQT